MTTQVSIITKFGIVLSLTPAKSEWEKQVPILQRHQVCNFIAFIEKNTVSEKHHKCNSRTYSIFMFEKILFGTENFKIQYIL